MKADTDPITQDEWLLRRVRVEKFKSDRVPLISPNAFEPRSKGRDPDIDGISLYRLACLVDARDVLASVPPERIPEYGIVQIPASMLPRLGLSVLPKPDVSINGHVVIPELNAGAYEADKARFTPIKLALATEASKEANILKRPGR